MMSIYADLSSLYIDKSLFLVFFIIILLFYYHYNSINYVQYYKNIIFNVFINT